MQPAPISPSQQLNDAYSKLLDDLNDAFWAANTLEAKDQIKGFSEIVTDVITTLDATDLSTRDAQFAAAQTQVTSVNKQLQTLQQQINGIISKINTATAIVSDVTQAISLAAKVFTL